MQRNFRPGAIARVTLPDTGEAFQARVSDVLPEVDPATRALKVRLIVNNPGFKLRPDMFVNVEMPVSVPPGLSVPADAIVDSGLAKKVFVQKSPGHFEKREVELGWRFDDRVQIVKGLRKGRSWFLPERSLWIPKAVCRQRPPAVQLGNAAPGRVRARSSHELISAVIPGRP